MAGCGSDDDSSDLSNQAAFADTGPYPVGVTRLNMGDRALEVWYPAQPGSERGLPRASYAAVEFLPESIINLLPEELRTITFEMQAYRDLAISNDGPFPVLTFSHGAGGFRLAYSALLAGIASHGFVVASIDHLEWGLLAFVGLPPSTNRSAAEVLLGTLELLRAENGRGGSPLAGGVDGDRVATAGHSAGGQAAFALLDHTEIKARIAYATVGSVNPAVTPVLFAVGALDPLGEGVERAYAGLGPTKRFISVANAGHNSFTDQCALIHGGTNIVEIVRNAGLPLPDDLAALALDGCREENLDPAQFRRVVQHFTVAHLRAAFAIGNPTDGLGSEVVQAFDGVEVRYLNVE